MFSRLSRASAHVTPAVRPSPAAYTLPSVASRYPNGTMSAITTTSTAPRRGRLYQSAACLVIGDEILNGKTIDTNSSFLAQHLFALGVPLQRIETIPDSLQDIAATVRRLSAAYDLVVTSGGIGPTHDDITYPAIASAYGLPLRLHPPTVSRMKQVHSRQVQTEGAAPQDWDTPSAQLDARLRMATFPAGEGVDYLFVDDDLWVPIVVVNHNIYILPGVPKLFRGLLESLTPVLLERGRISPATQRIHRVIISTPLPESAVAEYLATLQARVEARGVKVGSYPRWGKKRNTVTLVGRDLEFLESLVPEVERGVEGVRVMVEGDDDSDVEGGGGGGGGGVDGV
ncbi:molybdopterin binding domain protein [Tirmania nivea]|nr:molybdopterin binding domain protein [Tirmania nivea]